MTRAGVSTILFLSSLLLANRAFAQDPCRPLRAVPKMVLHVTRSASGQYANSLDFGTDQESVTESSDMTVTLNNSSFGFIPDSPSGTASYNYARTTTQSNGPGQAPYDILNVTDVGQGSISLFTAYGVYFNLVSSGAGCYFNFDTEVTIPATATYVDTDLGVTTTQTSTRPIVLVGGAGGLLPASGFPSLTFAGTTPIDTSCCFVPAEFGQANWTLSASSSSTDTVTLSNTSGNENGILVNGVLAGAQLEHKTFGLTTSDAVDLGGDVSPSGITNGNEVVAFTYNRPPTLLQLVPWKMGPPPDNIPLAFRNTASVPIKFWIVYGGVIEKLRIVRDLAWAWLVWRQQDLGFSPASDGIDDVSGTPGASNFDLFECTRFSPVSVAMSACRNWKPYPCLLALDQGRVTGSPEASRVFPNLPRVRKLYL